MAGNFDCRSYNTRAKRKIESYSMLLASPNTMPLKRDFGVSDLFGGLQGFGLEVCRVLSIHQITITICLTVTKTITCTGLWLRIVEAGLDVTLAD